MPKLNKARAVRILTSCTPLNVVQATWTNLLIDLVIEKIEQLTALEILHHIATCSERHLTEMPLSISEWGEHASNLNNLGIPGDFATSLQKKKTMLDQKVCYQYLTKVTLGNLSFTLLLGFSATSVGQQVALYKDLQSEESSSLRTDRSEVWHLFSAQ